MAGKAAPVRCFFNDIPVRVAQNQQNNAIPWNRYQKRPRIEPMLQFRLIGTVVDLRDALITLDDGTGLARIQATEEMVSKIRVSIGMSLECIVQVDCIIKTPQSNYTLIANGLN